jgi:hypothetical protein
VAGRIRSIEKTHLLGSRTVDLPACSIVPQPTTLPRAPLQTGRVSKVNLGSLDSNHYITQQRYWGGHEVTRNKVKQDETSA